MSRLSCWYARQVEKDSTAYDACIAEERRIEIGKIRSEEDNIEDILLFIECCDLLKKLKNDDNY